MGRMPRRARIFTKPNKHLCGGMKSAPRQPVKPLSRRRGRAVNVATERTLRGYEMKTVTSLIFGAVLLGSAVVASAGDIAGNVTLTTDYRFRGISQNNGKFSP